MEVKWIEVLLYTPKFLRALLYCGFLVETYLLPLNFAFWRHVKIRGTAGDSNHRNGRTIFALLIIGFTYLPAKIAKIKGARKFRGLQYLTTHGHYNQTWKYNIAVWYQTGLLKKGNISAKYSQPVHKEKIIQIQYNISAYVSNEGEEAKR